MNLSVKTSIIHKKVQAIVHFQNEVQKTKIFVDFKGQQILDRLFDFFFKKHSFVLAFQNSPTGLCVSHLVAFQFDKDFFGESGLRN